MNLSTTHSPPSRTRGLLLAFGALLQSGCSLFGVHGVDEAVFRVLDDQGEFQLRRYESMVVASTSVSGDFDEASNIAFRRLFAYISGANTAGTGIAMTTPVISSAADSRRIPMTAPVTAEESGEGWSLAFVLPAGFTLASAPRPHDDSVRLRAVPRHTAAVVSFSGSWNQSAYRDELARLREWMQHNRLEPASEPRIARYDPPWTLPFLRRNEILIDVES